MILLGAPYPAIFVPFILQPFRDVFHRLKKIAQRFAGAKKKRPPLQRLFIAEYTSCILRKYRGVNWFQRFGKNTNQR